MRVQRVQKASNVAGSLGQGEAWLEYRRTVQKDLMRPKEGKGTYGTK